MQITDVRQIAARIGAETRRAVSHPVAHENACMHCLEAVLKDCTLSAEEKKAIWSAYNDAREHGY